MFLLLAVFIRQGGNPVAIEIGIAVVTLALIARLIYLIFRKDNVKERPVTWRTSLCITLYWILLAVILGRDFSNAWIFWALAGLFAAGTIIILLSKKKV